MIDLYTWMTPNGQKVSIMLEEVELPYRVHRIDIEKGAQFDPEFLKISPNNKIPAIVDHDTGLQLMESGAILLYLAEKTGRLLPQDFEAKWRTIEWLMWQMGGAGPFLGQVHHFVAYNPGKSPYGEARYTKEARRLWRVLETRLGDVEYVAGDYSIADISIWPWIARYPIQPVEMDEHPNIKRWYHAIAARPAVQRGWDVVGAGRKLPLP
ncbi:glutathione S-transferase [Methyloceanibacter methanicus]|uniref:Glutathione S-transferase n=1 Tax=Methyloceanibacter methanicus TaxID=1774968 RepID=A0A1E3VY30_9HYPH|nr:glutathione S-transferase N-terminal domain-containing protein [Methyloceanibacter methanicus]ODR98465.1 glutathione S-transferase [Methyloceanibacter methanicus]